MEYWSTGVLGTDILLLQYSITPILHHSILLILSAVFCILSSSFLTLDTLGTSLDAYFLIRQIAGRVRRPQIIGHGFGPHSEIACADVQPLAGSAAAFHMLLLVFEFCHHRMGKIRPDLAEGFLQNVSKAEVSPELIRMHGPVPADAADAPS